MQSYPHATAINSAHQATTQMPPSLPSTLPSQRDHTMVTGEDRLRFTRGMLLSIFLPTSPLQLTLATSASVSATRVQVRVTSQWRVHAVGLITKMARQRSRLCCGFHVVENLPCAIHICRKDASVQERI